ncbi:hypothetical protein ISX56_34400, partial [Serratia ureilytica]|nr:hypothetical protein [Serratia ureilytica]
DFIVARESEGAALKTLIEQRLDGVSAEVVKVRAQMPNILHVKTAPKDYSQGEDLFTAQRRNNWIATGDGNQLVITTPTQTLIHLVPDLPRQTAIARQHAAHRVQQLLFV